jgi:hypothetical protein
MLVITHFLLQVQHHWRSLFSQTTGHACPSTSAEEAGAEAGFPKPADTLRSK